MNIRDLSAVDSAARYLDELVRACHKLGPIYCENPKLTTNVSRKAKSLRPTLAALRAFFIEPKGERA